MTHLANTPPIDQPLPSLALELADGFTDVFGSTRGSGETKYQRRQRQDEAECQALLRERAYALASTLEQGATVNQMRACIERYHTLPIDADGYWELHDAIIKSLFRNRRAAYTAPIVWSSYSFKFDVDKGESVAELHHTKSDYYRNKFLASTEGVIPATLLECLEHVHAIYRAFVVDSITRRVCIMNNAEIINLLGSERITKLEALCGAGNAHRGMNVHIMTPVVSKWFDKNTWQDRLVQDVASPADAVYKALLKAYSA